jgi:hypothetical protein
MFSHRTRLHVHPHLFPASESGANPPLHFLLRCETNRGDVDDHHTLPIHQSCLFMREDASPGRNPEPSPEKPFQVERCLFTSWKSLLGSSAED